MFAVFAVLPPVPDCRKDATTDKAALRNQPHSTSQPVGPLSSPLVEQEINDMAVVATFLL